MTGVREIKIQPDADLVDKIEKTLCFAKVNGELVKVRSLKSIATEAFYRGIKLMAIEESELKKKLGDGVFLSKTGVGIVKGGCS